MERERGERESERVASVPEVKDKIFKGCLWWGQGLRVNWFGGICSIVGPSFKLDIGLFGKYLN